VTRARMSQIMNLLNLAPDVQEALLFLPEVVKGKDQVTERQAVAESKWRSSGRRGEWSSSRTVGHSGRFRTYRPRRGETRPIRVDQAHAGRRAREGAGDTGIAYGRPQREPPRPTSAITETPEDSVPIVAGTFQATDPELAVFKLALPDCDQDDFDKSATLFLNPGSGTAASSVLRAVQQAIERPLDPELVRVALSLQSGRKIAFGFFEHAPGSFRYAYWVNPPNSE